MNLEAVFAMALWARGYSLDQIRSAYYLMNPLVPSAIEDAYELISFAGDWIDGKLNDVNPDWATY